jgi:ubiquinone/menaquinone biosynthesis C-methylase UbiE
MKRDFQMICIGQDSGMPSNKGYSKESYIALHDREWWGKHPNIDVMKKYKSYLRGTIGDLGCNNAWCTSFIPDISEVFDTIIGIDINSAAIEQAKINMRSIGKDFISFKKASLCDLPFNSDYFDCLTFFHTLEHIYEDDIPEVLGGIRKVLKPGGRLIITVPYENFHKDECHVSFFSVETLRLTLESADFNVEDVYIDKSSGIEGLITGVFYK